MAEKVRSVRISDPVWKLLEDLTCDLRLVPELGADGQLTTSKVLRLALLEGIQVLKQKYRLYVFE
jgi:hypothetical protein